MPDPKYTAYEAAAPYFDLVRGALEQFAIKLVHIQPP